MYFLTVWRRLCLLACALLMHPVSAQTRTPSAEGPRAPAVYTTPPAVVERLQRYLPKTYSKLKERQPVHVVAIGDDLVDMTGYGDEGGNQLLGWPARFVNELAQEFFYGGGVRIIQPNRGKPDRVAGRMGPDITLRVLSTRGGQIQKAMPMLLAYGFESPPDLVIASFGQTDSVSPTDPMLFAKALRELVDTVRARGADLFLAGPALTVADPPEASLAATRPYAGIMRDAAQESGVAFADLGDLVGLVRLQTGEEKPEQVFAEVVQQYRRFFAWPGVQDWVHPQPVLHRMLGTSAYKALTELAKPLPWSIVARGARFSSADQVTVSYDIANSTEAPLSLTLLPLKLPRWLPKDAEEQVQLKPGKKKRMTITYQRENSPAAARFPAVPSHEPLLRMPLLVAGAGTARIEELSAIQQPLALMWNLDALTNQTGAFELDNIVLNTSGKELKDVAWETEWQGQKKTGKFSLAANASTTLALRFELPKSAGPRRVTEPLILNAVVDGVQLRWERFIEATQNIGLKQTIPLTPQKPGPGSISFRSEADATALKLLFDIDGFELEADPTGTGLLAQINLDARSYGKRLMFGSTEAIVIMTRTSEGEGMVSPIAPWAFGTGYGMKFDSQGVKATLSKAVGGRYQFSVSVPRSYLYLHEWALGNGNSQLGVNVRLSLWKNGQDGPKGGYPPERSFALALTGRQPSDAEGLAVLELTEKPTTRWSVVVW